MSMRTTLRTLLDTPPQRAQTTENQVTEVVIQALTACTPQDAEHAIALTRSAGADPSCIVDRLYTGDERTPSEIAASVAAAAIARRRYPPKTLTQETTR